MPSSIVLHLPHLPPAARAAVASSAAAWSASKAAELVAEINVTAGAIEWLAEQLGQGGDPVATLQAVAAAQLEILIAARAARVYAQLGGDHVAGEVTARLKQLEAADLGGAR